MCSNLEICWTGDTLNRNVRKTGPALCDLLYMAKRSILIVGYSIEPSAKDVMETLEEKSMDGVNITFMVDKLDKKANFLKWTENLVTPPELYTRPEDPDNRTSSLHIKCIVVDGKAVMFGSANMTYNGMKGNRELGLIIRDVSAVRTIIELLDELRIRELSKFNLDDEINVE